jgi:uncharacterized protein (TIGR04255 family)
MDNHKRRYKNPPVVEALCEINFCNSNWDSTIPGLFFEKIKNKYPKRKEINRTEINFKLSKDLASSEFKNTNPRIKFINNDNSGLVQIEKDLIVINQLKPYSSFENLKPIIIDVAGLYKSLTKPAGIKGINLRYINKITVPVDNFKMDDYFNLYPHYPQEWNIPAKFVTRLELIPKNREHLEIITFGDVPREGDITYSFMLDIYDILNKNDLSYKNISKYIDQAHENIIQTFETIITDKTRELFVEVK